MTRAERERNRAIKLMDKGLTPRAVEQALATETATVLAAHTETTLSAIRWLAERWDVPRET